MSRSDFRNYLRPRAAPELADQSRREWCRERLSTPTRSREMVDNWMELYNQPFVGITAEGVVEQALYARRSEDAPVEAIAASVRKCLAVFSDAEREAMCFPADAREWRRWHNTPNLIETDGLSLLELGQPARDAVLEVVRASLSEKGYRKVLDFMKSHDFVGQLAGMPLVFNRWTFHFLLFGHPDAGGPWGWQLYGHHLALNCVLLDDQMVFTPFFLGAEPAFVDEGPDKGIEILQDEQAAGLALMAALTPDQRARATLLPSILNAYMTPEIFHWADGRHRGGAFQDNRIIAYEGLALAELDDAQWEHVDRLIEHFLEPLPDGPRAARIAEVRAHRDRMFFAWMGGTGGDEPFYYRLHSPVFLGEFDHHAGILLANEEPARFHIHTIVRSPNGNDFGYALRSGENDR